MAKLFEDYNVGEKASFTKTVTESDVYTYAGVTGDYNPAHVNKVYAENSMFKGRIAHGMFAGGLISAVLGTKMPGEGAIYISQNLKFLAPVYFDDTITAECEIIEKLEKGRLKIKTTCTNQNNVVVVDGEAILMIPRPKK